MSRILSLLTRVMIVGLAACGDDGTGPSTPNVRGNYSAAFTQRVTDIATGQFASVACSGSMSITGQNGGSFSGSFIILGSSSCGNASTGTLTGDIRGDGGINFGLTFPGAGTGIPGCTFTSSDTEFNGVFAGNQINASMSANMFCIQQTGLRDYRLEFGIIAVKN